MTYRTPGQMGCSMLHPYQEKQSVCRDGVAHSGKAHSQKWLCHTKGGVGLTSLAGSGR
jgi:hypothetical protein